MFTTDNPKRNCKKYATLRKAICSTEHFKLGDVLEPIPESVSRDGNAVRKRASELYQYIEIDNIGHGEFDATPLRGWQLPTRAKHFAEKGDIFIASIWGNVEKWCIIIDNSNRYVVTNGCHRFKIKEGKEDYLIDLFAYLLTDSFATQMRALTRGSDGLAEITVDDATQVLIPRITDNAIRTLLKPFVDALLNGRQSLHAAILTLLSKGELNIPIPLKRPNHTVLV